MSRFIQVSATYRPLDLATEAVIGETMLRIVVGTVALEPVDMGGDAAVATKLVVLPSSIEVFGFHTHCIAPGCTKKVLGNGWDPSCSPYVLLYKQLGNGAFSCFQVLLHSHGEARY